MDDPIKIYEFPKGLKYGDNKWVAIGKTYSDVWSYDSNWSLEEIKNKKLTMPIGDYAYCDFGRLVLECAEGKHEEFLRWSADEKEIQRSEDECLCNCSIRQLMITGCQCGGK